MAKGEARNLIVKLDAPAVNHVIYNDGTDWTNTAQTGIDHGSITGLSDDDHTQYALLAGRAGGQTLYGGTAAADNITLSASSDAAPGYAFIQPTSATKTNFGSTSTGLLGSYTIACVGPDSSFLSYPSLALYTDADLYPLFTYLPFRHNNVQQLWECYYDGSIFNMRVCNPGIVVRQALREDIGGTGQDAWKIEWYDASGDAQGDAFSDASWNSAFTIDNAASQIVINYKERDFDFRICGDSESNLIYCDSGTPAVGIKVVPSGSYALEVNGATGITGNLTPTADASYDLGAVGGTDYRWQHLYLSGNISDETNTVTVANLKTAYDHSQIAGGDSVHVSVAENSNWDAGYTHVSNNGSDHSYIDQNVTTTGTPTFSDLTITDRFKFHGTGSTYCGISAGNTGSSTGTYCNGFGQYALGDLTDGTHNNAFGFRALNENTGGDYNCGFGRESGRYNTTGGYNAFYGSYSGKGVANQPYTANSGFGAYALAGLTTGDYNFAGGFNAGNDVTTGSYNIFLGTSSGSQATTESYQFQVHFKDEGNWTAQKAAAILHGEMNDTTSSQVLTINASTYITQMPSGATQAASGASAGELWSTSGHATLPDNVVMIGV